MPSRTSAGCFNEAAGFTRRKRAVCCDPISTERQASMRPPDLPGGNAASFSMIGSGMYASMRPPDLPGGNADSVAADARRFSRASMRPPDLPGGNSRRACRCSAPRGWRFNEAAGFTRRKRAPFAPR